MSCNECIHYDVCWNASPYCNVNACKQFIARTTLANLQKDLALTMKEKTELKVELEAAKDCIYDIEEILDNQDIVRAHFSSMGRIAQYHRRNTDE